MTAPAAMVAPTARPKTPVRVVHVFSTFGPGGQQARTCTLMDALGDEFDHTLISTDGEYASSARLAPSTSYRVVPPPPGKGGLSYALAFGRTLRNLCPDLLLTYNWGAFDALMAAVLFQICPVIHIEDGFGADEAAGLKTRRVFMRRLFLNRTAGILVPSETLRTIAESRYRVTTSKIFYVPNGVDIERFHPGADAEWRREYSIPSDALLVGFVGRLSAEKNVSMLVRAMRRVPDAHLALVGSGPQREELSALANAMGLGARVTFAGELADTSRAYRAFDLFALPSLTEQMPMSLLEAMATGLPAVCTNVGDCSSMLEDSESPAIVPVSENAMSDALDTFARDAKMRSYSGARNRSIAEARFSLQAMIDRHATLYRTAAAG